MKRLRLVFGLSLALMLGAFSASASADCRSRSARYMLRRLAASSVTKRTWNSGRPARVSASAAS